MAKITTTKSAEKKQVIVSKAANLFRNKGFAASTMRELADEVGVEAASLYNHIGNKNEMLQTICFTVAQAFTTHLQSIQNSKLSNTQKLETIIRFHIKMMINSFNEVYVANHEWKHLKEPDLGNFLLERRNYEKSLLSIVEAGILKKEFKSLNAYVMVLTILSAVRGLEFWQRHKKNVSLTILENDMVTHLLYGLKK
jgi:TetR/AcrR family transcriptional regulator, cholesterol catabolism regulator